MARAHIALEAKAGTTTGRRAYAHRAPRMPVCSLRSRGVLAVLAMLGASGEIVVMLPEVLGRSRLRVAPGGRFDDVDLTLDTPR